MSMYDRKFSGSIHLNRNDDDAQKTFHPHHACIVRTSLCLCCSLSNTTKQTHQHAACHSVGSNKRSFWSKMDIHESKQVSSGLNCVFRGLSEPGEGLRWILVVLVVYDDPKRPVIGLRLHFHVFYGA